MSIQNYIHNLKLINQTIIQHQQIKQIIPLLQNLVDSKTGKKQTFIQNAQQNLNSPEFIFLLHIVEAINIKLSFDINFTNLFPPQFIYFHPFYRTYDNFSIAFIAMPKGQEFSLHDHCNMVVLTKVIYGQLEIQSMDIDEQYKKVTKFMRNELQNRRKNSFYRKKISKKSVSSLQKLINIESKKTQFEEYGPQFYDACKNLKIYQNFSNPNCYRVKNFKKTILNTQNSEILTPTKGNIHRLISKSDCIVIDVLLPDYKDDLHCSFYEYCSNFSESDPFIYRVKLTRQQKHLKDLRLIL